MKRKTNKQIGRRPIFWSLLSLPLRATYGSTASLKHHTEATGLEPPMLVLSLADVKGFELKNSQTTTTSKRKVYAPRLNQLLKNIAFNQFSGVSGIPARQAFEMGK